MIDKPCPEQTGPCPADNCLRHQHTEPHYPGDETLRHILGLMGETYFETDLEGTLTVFDDFLCDLHMRSAEELKQIDYRTFMTPEEADRWSCILSEVSRTGNPSKVFEFDIVAANGSRVTFSNVVALRRDPAGRAIGFCGIARDITRKNRESEHSYRQVLAIAPYSIAIMRLPDFRYVQVNEAFCNRCGYSQEEVLGRTPWELNLLDQSSTVLSDFLRKVATDRKIDDMEIRYRAKTGEIREDKRRAENKLIESEQRFRTIVESAQDAIFLKDRDLRYTLVNPVMETLLGMRADSFIGRSDEQIFRQKDTVLSDQRVLNGEIVEEEEIRQVNGVKKILHCIKVPMRDIAGHVTGLCGFTRDLTGTRTLEAQLLRAQKMEAIGTLAGGISHDFNNLLQGILGYTQILILGRSTSDAEIVKLREIERAAKRASELTARLLAFSRKVETHLRPVNLNRIIDQFKKLLERTIPKMIDIQLRLADSIHTINADPGQLEQVILNIGLNARDAMPEGGILTIETSNVHADESTCAISLDNCAGDYVLLSITDTGHGMAQEVRERIFEPFFTTKQIGQGTGLGMAMAYGIIQNHHGHITCESQTGVGTRFNIYLPAIKMKGQTLIEEPETPLHRGQGETLLVIDDELFIRELAQDMLSMSGYQVLTAESGEAGLALYEQHRHSIALIILDLIMPGKGGKQCMADILKINPCAKILIASGFSIQEPAENEVLSQALGFIQKPYNFKKMLQLIREIIDC